MSKKKSLGLPSVIFHMSLLSVAVLASQGVARAQATVFATVPMPVGVEADRAGNVYVSHTTYPYNYLSKFARNGVLLQRLAYQGIHLIGDHGRIARIPNTDIMLMLGSRGAIYIFGPGLTQPMLYQNLEGLRNTVINRIYDITTRRFISKPVGYMEWGDLAVSWRNNSVLSLYLSATSAGFPFAFRLDANLVTNRWLLHGLVTSTGTTAGNFNRPRGIAVNNKGWVLTGLPAHVLHGGYVDSLVAFPATFPENVTVPPFFVLRTSATRAGVWDAPSVGMATDALGNFYVATGAFGSSLCGIDRSSALLIISPIPAAPRVRCALVPARISSSNDVAVSPVGSIPYLTFGGISGTYQVLKFNPQNNFSAAAPESSTTATPFESADLGKLLELRLLPIEESR